MPTLPDILLTDEHGQRVGQDEIPPFVQTQAQLDRSGGLSTLFDSFAEANATTYRPRGKKPKG